MENNKHMEDQKAVVRNLILLGISLDGLPDLSQKLQNTL